MKYLLKLSAVSCLILILSSCSTESLDDTYAKTSNSNYETSAIQFCSGQNPQSKLINNGTITFTFKIIDSNDNTMVVHNISPGTSSSWMSFTEGETLFSIDGNTANVDDSKLLLDMSNCSEVEIVVNSLNEVNNPVILSLD